MDGDMVEKLLEEEEKEVGLIEKEIGECSVASEDEEAIQMLLKYEVENVENTSVKKENADHYTQFQDQFNLPMYKCTHCNLTYSQKHVMEKHIKRHTTHTQKSEENNTSFKCKECQKHFNRPCFLKLHNERVHIKLKRYFCFVGQKGFHERQRMLEHLQVHDDARKMEERFLTDDLKNKLTNDGHVMFEGRKVLKEHVCPYCSKVFRTRQVMKRHEQTHLNYETGEFDRKINPIVKNNVKIDQIKIEQTYSCKLDCIKRYYSEVDLAKHMEIADHKGGFFFTCANCPKKFASTKNLKAHICEQTAEGAPIPVPSHIPSQEKPITITNKAIPKQTVANRTPKIASFSDNLHNCKECGRNLPSSTSLEIHIKIHKEVNVIICKGHDCNETFPNQHEYWAHKDTIHNEKKLESCRTRVKCEVCGHICRSKHDLKSHMRKHTKEKNFICIECGKALKGKESMQNHTLLHKGAKNVGCDECGKMFVTRAAMISHKNNEHFIPGVFICPTCNADCRNKHKLKRHMAFHTNIRPFECRDTSGCGKTFHTNQTRNVHEKWHKGVNDYHCTKCPKEFMQKAALTVHLKRHDNIRNHKCNTCGKAFVEPAGARHCRHAPLACSAPLNIS